MFFAIGIASWFATVVLLAWLGGQALGPGAGPAAALVVLLCGCAAVACLAPFFGSAQDGARPIYSMVRALLKTLGLAAATVLAAGFAGVLLGTMPPVAWLLKTAAILAGFAALLAGVHTAAARLAGGLAGQLVAYLVAALMLGTVFYANPMIAVARGDAKAAAIQSAITANPLVCVAGAAADHDVFLSRRAPMSLYNSSLIGPDHLYHYPRWWVVCVLYAAVGLAFGLVASKLSRQPRGRCQCKEASG